MNGFSSMNWLMKRYVMSAMPILPSKCVMWSYWIGPGLMLYHPNTPIACVMCPRMTIVKMGSVSLQVSQVQ